MVFKEKLVVGVSILYFSISAGYIKSTNRINNKQYDELTRGISTRKRETERIKLSIDELTAALAEENEHIKDMEDIQDKLYEMDDFNSFVKKFEGIRKSYRGIDKVGYELIEEEGRAVISLSYRKNYSRLKEFIYDIEVSFPFLEISYLNMEKDLNHIKGNLNIQVYFRRSSYEG